MQLVWEWALRFDEEFAYRLYCLWEECSYFEFARLLQTLLEHLQEDLPDSIQVRAA